MLGGRAPTRRRVVVLRSNTNRRPRRQFARQPGHRPGDPFRYSGTARSCRTTDVPAVAKVSTQPVHQGVDLLRRIRSRSRPAARRRCSAQRAARPDHLDPAQAPPARSARASTEMSIPGAIAPPRRTCRAADIGRPSVVAGVDVDDHRRPNADARPAAGPPGPSPPPAGCPPERHPGLHPGRDDDGRQVRPVVRRHPAELPRHRRHDRHRGDAGEPLRAAAQEPPDGQGQLLRLPAGRGPHAPRGRATPAWGRRRSRMWVLPTSTVRSTALP